MYLHQIPLEAHASLPDFCRQSEAAALTLLGRRPVTPSFSAVELHLEQEEWLWLKTWLQHRRMVQLLQRAEGSMSVGNDSLGDSQILVGFLMHCLYAEEARRNSAGSELWVHLLNLWPESLKPGWFTSQNQPTELQRRTLRDAAVYLGMRNVFKEADTQAWYTTCHLPGQGLFEIF